jgi:hypothetical protein
MDKSRLKHLIKEVYLKKDTCNCGCHSCDNVGNPGVVLHESVAPKEILSENLQYHVDKQLPLTENTFRYGSEAFLNLWAEARSLYLREIIHVNEDDKQILEETDLGNYGMYEGKKVPLDLPMLDENSPAYKGPEGYDDSTDSYPEDELEEAEDKKKTPPIGKPKRGGSKKFYVYVRDKGKVKKVSFGGTTGLSVKINDPKARQAFAKRHRCSEKTDRTKPSYWSCRIGRYWKQLGGAKNFSGFW